MVKTVEEALAEQRKNINFSTLKISQFLYGKEFYAELKRKLNQQPVMKFNLNEHNDGRLESIKQAIRDFSTSQLINGGFMENDSDFIKIILNIHSQMPVTVHFGMFLKCLEIMGTKEQQDQYISKGKNLDIVGCYAQTEMAHGSDVQSLMTTAMYDQQTQQFIIETPTIDAIKFWPGDLGIFATHALVYANLTIKGKKYDIQSFIVPIRDPKTMAPLPGVQVGDIGPKIGFHTKDNGYLILKKVRIPRKNMLARFTEVQPDGSVINKGDPKISYATMMEIRKHISCNYPKLYAFAIIIATRYSMFRRQFKNINKQEIKIIDYQLQQEKIISRAAQYFAVTLAGNNINKICQENIKRTKDNDFSLMAETHACLSLGKPMISEIVYDGMQICRKACGGHGFSHYSGLPPLINEYACQLTYEGENTVLYLQVARYLMKSYKHYLTKKKKLGESVKYIQSFDYLTSLKINVETIEGWTLEDIRVLFAQGVCYLLSNISEKMMNKQQGVSTMDVWNKEAGSRLRQLAMMHSIYYIYNSFKEAVAAEKDQMTKAISTDLCLLFGINMLFSFNSPIIEGEYINSLQLKNLGQLKQLLLKKIRPNLIGIVDGFGIPDQYLKSALVYGNPYQNFLKLARENQLNHSRLQSVDVVKSIKKYMTNPNPSL